MSDSVPTSYVCMPRPKLVAGAFSVRAVQPHHIEDIRRWRNAQMNVLRQSAVITPAQQQAYFAEQVWPELAAAQPSNILLVCQEGDETVGYGALVHIAWEHRRAEVSFLLKPSLAALENEYARYFATFLQLMKNLAFEDLGLDRLFTETYATRRHHISVLESAGFRREGALRHHVRIDDKPVDSIIHGCLSCEEE